MNRRSFLQILAATAAPVIGLPELAAGAPAVAYTAQEAIDIGWEILQEIEAERPFRTLLDITYGVHR